MKRTPEMQKIVERMSPHPEAWKKGNCCALCGGQATAFKDAVSRREFEISRMCQACQDKVWP